MAILVASAAVGSVRSQVTEEPTPLGSPDVAALAGGVETAAQPATETTVDPLTTTSSGPAPSPLEAQPESATSSSTSPTTSTTTSTAATSTTLSATTSVPPSYAKTYDTDGGSVRIVVEGDAVTFFDAVPKTGWRVEVKDRGPEEVVVEFEQNDGDLEIEFSAKVQNGEVRPEISGE